MADDQEDDVIKRARYRVWRKRNPDQALLSDCEYTLDFLYKIKTAKSQGVLLPQVFDSENRLNQTYYWRLTLEELNAMIQRLSGFIDERKDAFSQKELF